jgi:Raf kinase inhibitor-like YbhB/YbcL family protein
MKAGLHQRDLLNRARRFARPAAVVSLCALAVLSACHREPDPARGQASRPLQVQSSSFANGRSIAVRNSCDGANTSPALQWSAPPGGARSIAIVMHDPDAIADFTHWIVFNIPPGVQSLPEGASKRAGMPQGSSEGTNDFGESGYGGPCPPGAKPHHYIFHVYALDLRLSLPPGVNRRQLDSAISGHILADGEIVGTYGHPGQ